MKSINLAYLLISAALFLPLKVSAQTWIRLQDSEQIEEYSGSTHDEIDVSSIVERGGFAYVNIRRYEPKNGYLGDSGFGVSIHCRNKLIEYSRDIFYRKNRKEWWSEEALAEGSRMHIPSYRAKYIQNMPGYLKMRHGINATRDKRFNAWYDFICRM